MHSGLFVIFGIFAFCTGACIASFLNVVIWRVPRGESVVSPASHCPKCNAPIRWWRNVPIVSWLLLRGRCADCHEPISPRYLLIEVLGGGVFLFAFWRFGMYAPLAWVWLSLMIVGSFVDFDLQLLPDFVTVGGIVYGLALGLAEWWLGQPLSFCLPLFRFDAGGWYSGAEALATGLIGFVLGFMLLGLIRSLGTLVFRREAMGMGDVILMGAVGMLFGPVAVLFSLVVSSLVGAVAGLLLVALSKIRIGGFVAIPYGPFICLGCLMWMFYGPELAGWYFRMIAG